MSGQQPGFVGYVFEVESYTEAKAIVFASVTSVLRYGALVLVDDQRSGRRYLGLVLDVSERSIAPSIDAQRLQQLSRQVQSMGFQNAQRLLQLLFSPTQSLVQWHGVRELRLRILGEIVQGQAGQPSLALPSQPPRPMSLVLEPDTQLLQQLLSGSLSSGGGGLYLGFLAYNPTVKVYLDPDRLTMHAAVLGQTGSGKTETVKRLIAEYAAHKHVFSGSGGVVAFDIAGEYTGYPYDPRPKAFPLLDMALHPQLYGYQNSRWLSNTRKTVLVPYDLASIGFRRAAEQQYLQQLARFVAELSARYTVEFRGLAYGRHGIYRLEPNGAIVPIDRAEAARMIISEPLLVVAAPLPSTLTVDEIVELAKTSASTFPDLVESAADTLSLLEVATVNEVKGLADTINVLNRLGLGKNEWGKSVSTLATALREAVEKYRSEIAQGRDATAAAASACRHLGEKLDVGFVDCWSLVSMAAYILSSAANELLSSDDVATYIPPSLQRRLETIASHHPSPSAPNVQGNPELNPWDVAAEALAADEELEKLKIVKEGLWRIVTKSLTRLAQTLSEESWQSRSSLVRGLRRVSRHLSAYLDASHYRLLVERLVDGFTIVHLAEPSRGDTDYAVARLVAEAFNVSVARYAPDRRTLLVVEEAHNLAPAGEDKASKRALLRIAREGRKWGLSLVLVSQRPGFIDPNVLSQTATLIALRITNPDDIAGLRRGSESASQEFIDRLPDLEQGQAVVAGVAVPERRVPLLVKVEMLKPAAQQGQAAGQAGKGTP